MHTLPISSNSEQISHHLSMPIKTSVTETETLGSSTLRASRRRLKAETYDPRARAYYYMLEKEADARMAESCQSDWIRSYRDKYKREFFFRNIIEKYEEASSLAFKLSQFEDAARLKEKQALVVAQKLDGCLGASCYLLLDAWKGYAKVGHSGKMATVGGKALEFADRHIADQYALKERCSEIFKADMNRRIASALLLKSELFEVLDPFLAKSAYQETEKFCEENDVSYSYIKEMQHWTLPEKPAPIEPISPKKAIKAADLLDATGLKEQAYMAYEEAGKRCMEYYKEDIAVDKIHSALIAGLCFEKSPNCQEQAKIAFEKVLESMQRLDSIKEEMQQFAIIVTMPLYLQAMLASLKLGQEDLFAKFIREEVLELTSFAKAHPTFSESKIVIDYAKALINVAEIILAGNSKELIKLKEGISFQSSLQTELPKTDFEAALLAVFAAPNTTTVGDMIDLLENKRLPTH